MTRSATNVTRIHTDGGSHIEPDLDQLWPALTKLQWKAAVVAHDTGLRVAVTPSRTTINGIPQRGLYCIQVGHGSAAPYNYDQAWSYLSGVAAGATA